MPGPYTSCKDHTTQSWAKQLANFPPRLQRKFLVRIQLTFYRHILGSRPQKPCQCLPLSFVTIFLAAISARNNNNNNNNNNNSTRCTG